MKLKQAVERVLGGFATSRHVRRKTWVNGNWIEIDNSDGSVRFWSQFFYEFAGMNKRAEKAKKKQEWFDSLYGTEKVKDGDQDDWEFFGGGAPQAGTWVRVEAKVSTEFPDGILGEVVEPYFRRDPFYGSDYGVAVSVAIPGDGQGAVSSERDMIVPASGITSLGLTERLMLAIADDGEGGMVKLHAVGSIFAPSCGLPPRLPDVGNAKGIWVVEGSPGRSGGVPGESFGISVENCVVRRPFRREWEALMSGDDPWKDRS